MLDICRRDDDLTTNIPHSAERHLADDPVVGPLEQSPARPSALSRGLSLSAALVAPATTVVLALFTVLTADA
ncbi:hypothetical protein V5D56_07760 [Cellulosimicrobium sp. PMB13]|uniref:hypothetical protein n=1 Tax=Cellulosimicrobium sp. PMB13 TaxID=3120158 RepID=UPI003F4B90E1